MFEELREELKKEVDNIWSESVRLLPLKDGMQDTDRQKVVLSAILRTGDREPEGMNFGSGKNARSSVMANGGYLRIDRTAYPDLIVKKHDKLLALSRDGTPVFEIIAVDDRSHLRLVCELGDS